MNRHRPHWCLSLPLPSKQHGGGGWPTLTPADRANTSACVVPKGSRWKFVPLLGEDLDLRRITWRLPPETIPRLSGSSHLSSDTEGLLHEEDSTVAPGTVRRSGTPQPQAGEGRLYYSTECPVLSCFELRGPRRGSVPPTSPCVPTLVLV